MTDAEAKDAIYGMLKTAWAAQAAPIPPLFYDDVPANPPTNGSPYAVAVLRHVADGQRTLGATGNRVFQRAGVIIIQVFGQSGTGLTSAARYAIVARDTYEGKASPDGGVWFRNVQKREIGQSGAHYQINVTAEFEYDEIK